MIINRVGQLFYYKHILYKVGENVEIESANYHSLNGMIVSIDTSHEREITPSANVLLNYPDGSFKTRKVNFDEMLCKRLQNVI